MLCRVAPTNLSEFRAGTIILTSGTRPIRSISPAPRLNTRARPLQSASLPGPRQHLPSMFPRTRMSTRLHVLHSLFSYSSLPHYPHSEYFFLSAHPDLCQGHTSIAPQPENTPTTALPQESKTLPFPSPSNPSSHANPWFPRTQKLVAGPQTDLAQKTNHPGRRAALTATSRRRTVRTVRNRGGKIGDGKRRCADDRQAVSGTSNRGRLAHAHEKSFPNPCTFVRLTIPV
jgi:hypothetical protein